MVLVPDSPPPPLPLRSPSHRSPPSNRRSTTPAMTVTSTRGRMGDGRASVAEQRNPRLGDRQGG